MSKVRSQSEDCWKQKLTPEQYQVCRMAGAEAAFSGNYWNNHKSGMYECVACGQPLFSSENKFDSGSGWPSFDDPVNKEHIELHEDKSHGMLRTEVITNFAVVILSPSTSLRINSAKNLLRM